MNKLSSGLKAQILDRISRSPANTGWTPADFLDLAGETRSTRRCNGWSKGGNLRRIDRGLYDKPQFNGLMGQDTATDPRAVIDAIARRDHIRILVEGMTAANDLGFTNAVPARIIVHSEARPKSIKLGNLVIEFKPTAASKFYWAGHPAMRIVQALHWLRDTMKTGDAGQWRERLAILLSDPTHGEVLRADLASGLPALPAWMQDLLRPLVSRASPVMTSGPPRS